MERHRWKMIVEEGGQIKAAWNTRWTFPGGDVVRTHFRAGVHDRPVS